MVCYAPWSTLSHMPENIIMLAVSLFLDVIPACLVGRSVELFGEELYIVVAAGIRTHAFILEHFFVVQMRKKFGPALPMSEECQFC